MKKIWGWLTTNHRIHRLGLGFVYGVAANSWYCAAYGGLGVAGALELKDHLWGGKPDIIDFLLTVAGVAAGFAIRSLMF